MNFTARERERFWAKVDIGDGCWEWRGAKSAGYGHVRLHRQGVLLTAHVFAFIDAGGRLAAVEQVDHLCRNRACVRPSHLEAVTASENTLRAKTRAAFCRRGHPIIEDAARVNGEWSCKQCAHVRTNTWLEKYRAKHGKSYTPPCRRK